ncbi:TonB-dependent receptor [Sphingomonas quercus]|uniref:TonB-dependent receptor n=1 Tax=Sphingomonas quercus TaxID=2842451 RepID=A0ABS6BFI5_9SPHN|nr:TonB-dependent receptor [Sphingomonas quercus]MBU3077056.1 TonB-dependent receptor [Sphingomonas quercus]
MRKSLGVLSVALAAAPLPAQAPPAGPDGYGDVVVTATRRASPLSDVPVAVSAVTGEALQNSGATDIRQLNQITPSLLVSSSASEAGAGGARIRGIGTVGDNVGLESSVATFIDGVYRSRAAVGLTELGPIERIEVLRGPQGTLFGRNASAGLINIVTARPSFDEQGYAEASYGNYDYYRLAGGITGPIGSKIAYRLDGVYVKRDGFVKDVISGRRINDRDRYLVRGKLLLEPSDSASILLSGDFANRKEECCAGPYLPANDVVRNADGTLSRQPSSIAALIRATSSAVPGNGDGKGVVLGDPFARRVALTPGRGFAARVRDWGLSAEANVELGDVKVTSISAWRDFNYLKGQDADFGNLDILYRPGDGSGFTRFRTFSQEVRAQGSAFGDRVDWLVGGYFAEEKLALNDNLRFGADFDSFASRRVGLLSPQLAAFPSFGFRNLSGFVQAAGMQTLAGDPRFAGLPAAARPIVANAVAGQVQNLLFADTGYLDRYRQDDRNIAVFTHNIVKLTDRLSLTLGARYTHDRKRLDADFASNSACAGYLANITRLGGLAASAGANPGGNGGANAAIAGLATGIAGQLAQLTAIPCVVGGAQFAGSSRNVEKQWSGTAVLSYKPTDRLLGYASYARGYKAGGFNLDRAPLLSAAALSANGGNVAAASTTNLDVLKFKPETVDSFELGLKYDGRRFDINVAAFYERFRSFQLNTFNGTNFLVTDIRGCKTGLGLTDQDLVTGNSNCSDLEAGVVSKGVEIEAMLQPARDLRFNLGYTYADTRYAKDLAGTPDFFVPANGNSLVAPAFLLPGSHLSNAPVHVVTGSGSFTPPLWGRLRGLVYADFRYTSEFNTGSDLFYEKRQQGAMIVNARLGIGPDDRSWSLEFWGQNLLDTDTRQVVFNAPLQGSNSSALQTQRFGTTATQLFGAFLGEPRTYGVTLRTLF